MKRQSDWVVSTGETLKDKRHTIVLTKSFCSLKREPKELEIITSCHITVKEARTSEALVKKNIEEVLLVFKTGSQATVDELKEVNLGTTNNR